MNLRRAISIGAMLISANISAYAVYRVEMIVWVIGGTVPLFMMFIWTELAKHQPVAGYDQSAFAAYFLMAFLVRHMTPFIVLRELDREIRLGGLSARLLRPLDPYWGLFVAQATDALFRLPIVIPIMIAGFLLTDAWHAVYWERSGLFALALIGSVAVFFHLHYCLGLMAFWTDRIVAVEGLIYTMYFSLGGGLIPIDLLPGWAQAIVAATPFPYILGLPVELITKQMPLSSVGVALLIQYSWAAGLAVAGRVLWHRGLRRYEAVGA